MRQVMSVLMLASLFLFSPTTPGVAAESDASVSSFQTLTYGEMNVIPPRMRYVVPLKLKKQACAVAAFAVDAETKGTVNVDAVLCDKRGKILGACYNTFFPLIKVTPGLAGTYTLVITNESCRPIILSCKVN